MEWIPIEDQAADGLIKALDSIKYARFVQQLGLINCAEAIRDLIGAAASIIRGNSSAGSDSAGTSNSTERAVGDATDKAVDTK